MADIRSPISLQRRLTNVDPQVLASIELEGYLVSTYQPRLYDYDPQPLQTTTETRVWFEPIEDEL